MLRHFAFIPALAFLTTSTLAAEGPSPAPPPEPQGMVKMFNGQDINNWDGDPRLWSAHDCMIRGQTTTENPAHGNTFLIWKGDGNVKTDPAGHADVADFDLRLSFKITGGNSGVQYRSRVLSIEEQEKIVGGKKANPKKKNKKGGETAAAAPQNTNPWMVTGYQAEIANVPGKDGFMYHEKGPNRGYSDNGKYLCRVGDKTEIAEDGSFKIIGKVGDQEAIGNTYHKSDWNDYVIIARGNHLQHFINGHQTIDFTDNDPKNHLTHGILALQLHAGQPMEVDFKDLRIKIYDSK